MKRAFSTASSGSGLNNLNLLKRFYNQATVQQIKEPPHPKHRFAVKLDGKTVKTPNRHVLAMPTPKLAFLVAHQLNMQSEHIKPALMPLLGFCRTAVDIDFSPHIREHLLDSVHTFLPTDTLLFFEDESSGYRERYEEKTVPALKMFEKEFDMKVEPSQDLTPPQVSASSEKLLSYINGLDNWELIGLESITILLKSTISACLITKGLISPNMGAQLARLQQVFQSQRFGWVEERRMQENNVKFITNTSYLMFSACK